MGLAFLLVPGVIASAREEVVVGAFEVIEGPFYDTFGDLVCPRVFLLSDLVELFFERERIGRGEHALLFGERFLFLLVRLILLFSLFPPPVVDEAPRATGSFEVLHLFKGGVHPDLASAVCRVLSGRLGYEVTIESAEIKVF